MSGPSSTTGLERILEFVRQSRGFDFTAYKRTSLTRRVRTRMNAVQIHEFDAYLDYLQAHRDEFPALFDTVLINATRFFRDPEVWDGLCTTVLPLLTGAADTAVRVWSAGTATGQEAYTVAMLLAEQMGLDTFGRRVKIYATDVDGDALREARKGIYTEAQIADVPEALRTKYFARAGDGFQVAPALRRSVSFRRHDLLQDAPLSRIHLLLCRNTLMYFNVGAQANVIAKFHAAVVPFGHLVLGRPEMIFNHDKLFEPIDLTRRIFTTTRQAARHRGSRSGKAPRLV